MEIQNQIFEIQKPISLSELEKSCKILFGGLIKAVVDIENRQIAVNGELYVEEEQFLLSKWSKQDNLRWINLYPEYFGTEDWVEFDSMINLRPSQWNRSRSVENIQIQEKIKKIVSKFIL